MSGTRVLVMAMLTLVAGMVHAAPTDTPLRRVEYALPAWDAAVKSTGVTKYTTEDEYATALRDSRFVLEKIRYRSDNLDVVAYVYRPAAVEGKKRPVIVFNRGSYIRADTAPELLPMFHRLAMAGFAVVAPMYRGSDGGEGQDEMGGADLNDLMGIIPVISQFEAMDDGNIFLYGESRGGMMVLQALRDGFPARAAAVFGAFTDLGEMTASAPGAAMAKKIWPDFDRRQSEIIARRSAVQWPEKLALPLLLMHGSMDREVPVVQALALAGKLAQGKKDFGAIFFPGGSHSLKSDRVERDRHAVEFFLRHLSK